MKFRSVRIVIKNVFITLLVIFLLALLPEEIFPSIVSKYLKTDYLLWIVISFGIITVLFPLPEKKVRIKKTRWNYLYASTAGIATFAILFYKFQQLRLGYLQVFLPIIGGILVFLLSVLLLEEDESSE